MMCLFCFFEALRPDHQCFSPPVLSNGGEVSFSRIQHRTPGEDRTRDLAIKCLMLSQLSYRCSSGGNYERCCVCVLGFL